MHEFPEEFFTEHLRGGGGEKHQPIQCCQTDRYGCMNTPRTRIWTSGWGHPSHPLRSANELWTTRLCMNKCIFDQNIRFYRRSTNWTIGQTDRYGSDTPRTRINWHYDWRGGRSWNRWVPDGCKIDIFLYGKTTHWSQFLRMYESQTTVTFQTVETFVDGILVHWIVGIPYSIPKNENC